MTRNGWPEPLQRRPSRGWPSPPAPFALRRRVSSGPAPLPSRRTTRRGRVGSAMGPQQVRVGTGGRLLPRQLRYGEVSRGCPRDRGIPARCSARRARGAIGAARALNAAALMNWRLVIDIIAGSSAALCTFRSILQCPCFNCHWCYVRFLPETIHHGMGDGSIYLLRAGWLL